MFGYFFIYNHLDETKIATRLVNACFQHITVLWLLYESYWGVPPIEFRDYSHVTLTRSPFARVVGIWLPLGQYWWLRFERSI